MQKKEVIPESKATIGFVKTKTGGKKSVMYDVLVKDIECQHLHRLQSLFPT